VAAVDGATAQIGKLSADGCAFEIDPAIGSLEFEAEENELTLTVSDLNGEWGIFVPAAGEAAAAAGADAAATGAGEEAAAEGAEESETEGVFDAAIAVPGGNTQTDVVYPPNVSSLDLTLPGYH
jgi:hypothetical protein